MCCIGILTVTLASTLHQERYVSHPQAPSIERSISRRKQSPTYPSTHESPKHQLDDANGKGGFKIQYGSRNNSPSSPTKHESGIQRTPSKGKSSNSPRKQNYVMPAPLDLHGYTSMTSSTESVPVSPKRKTD